MEYPKTLFLHGRPGPHPFHEALAHSVNADFLPVDYLLRCHDRPTSRVYRYLSWLLCGIRLPRQPYQVILSEGPYMPPVVAKRLGLLRRRQKIAALLSGETLYFIKSGYYPARTCTKLRKLLGLYDGLICTGPLTTKLAHELVRRGPVILTIPVGLNHQRAQKLAKISPRLEGNRLLLVAQGPGGFRAWYKGVDLLLDALARVAPFHADLQLVIVGEWDAESRAYLLGRFPELARRVVFAGYATDLEEYMSHVANSCLCVHLARGDACPISVLEVMAGGVPAIVSDCTGTYEAVAQVDPSLVVPLDPQAAAEHILRYLRSSLEEKRRLSAACRQVALAKYTQQHSIERFRSALVALVRPGIGRPVEPANTNGLPERAGVTEGVACGILGPDSVALSAETL
jgi:glycosyltransferase involved in cell wall biosynthesis